MVKMPETNVVTLTVDPKGRVFFNVDGQFTRAELLISWRALWFNVHPAGEKNLRDHVEYWCSGGES